MANDSPHSPAPWSTTGERGAVQHVVDSNGKPVAEHVWGTEWPYLPNQQANAHLIAAAPELLAALRAAVNLIVAADGFMSGSTDELEAVIAKAEGKVL